VETAALVAVTLIGVVIVFQIALAAGAPWGSAAWGGRHEGRLPGRLRAASALSTVLLALAAWVILAESGLVDTSPVPDSWLEPLAWVVTAYFAIGAMMNLISPSRVERIWSPVSLIIAVCAGIVAAV
jgi:hypothetical protein